MPTILRIESTPNPDALKFICDRALGDPPRSYRSRATAPAPGTDPLADAIFALPEVAGLLICADWVSVNKDHGAKWSPLRARIKRAIESTD